jgi:hypothetical protein
MVEIRGTVSRVGLTAALLMAAAGASFGAEIAITAPAPGAEVSGIVQVVARVVVAEGEEVTDPVLQTAEGLQAPLLPNDDGAYAAELDTTRLRNGRQSLMVLVTPTGVDDRREGYDDVAWAGDRFITVAEVPVLVRNPYHRYWGDLHAHSSYSDGAWYPREVYEFARDEAKLDFFAVTDHLEILTADEYGEVVAGADEVDEPGRFVALYGVERTNEATGHINFYMSPTHVLPTELSHFYRALGEMWLLGHFNHPTLTPSKGGNRHNDFQQFRYAPEADRCMAMVEVRNPVEEACYIALLNRGWHVGAAGDEDRHSPNWGQGPTWTVVLARELTREGILDALWARRTYSAADRDLQLCFTVDGEDMGSQIARPAGALDCHLLLNDPSGDVVERADLFVDGRIAASAEVNAAQHEWTVPMDLAPGQHYCLVRVRQSGNRTTWSSPVWVSAYTPE